MRGQVGVGIAQLPGGCSPGVVNLAGEQFLQQTGVGRVNPPVDPEGFELVVAEALVPGIKIGGPGIEFTPDLFVVAVSKLPLGPVAVAIFPALEQVEEGGNGGTGNFGRIL